jgi:pimeloyl-ACP methyl ester carboxylesterase
VGDDAAVADFLRLMTAPRRRENPGVAASLERAERLDVPTAHGDVAAWRLGDGPAVLLVHGRDDDHMLWDPLIAALDAAGHPVVAFDLPAHGLSGGTACIAWEATDAVLAVADAAGPIKSVVGHSVGVGALLGAIDEGLPVARGAFIAPPFRGGDRWLRIATENGFSEAVAERARASYDSWLTAERKQWNNRESVVRVDCELLFLHSNDDERVPVQATRDVAAECKHAQVFVVDGPRHRATARDPAIIEGIVSFV